MPPKMSINDARHGDSRYWVKNVRNGATISGCPSCKYLVTARANAWFSSSAVGTPMGTSGSPKTRARVISASVGVSENTGYAGAGVTVGTDRFTLTAGGALL